MLVNTLRKVRADEVLEAFEEELQDIALEGGEVVAELERALNLAPGLGGAERDFDVLFCG